ncbi:MAG: DUF4838 domain-containing protein [Saprospiraceae bacterium]
MKSLSTSFLLGLVVNLLVSCQSSSSISLVSGGTSDYTINIADNATELETKAAEVLQDYLQQISGVSLAIHTGKGAGKEIRIGQLGQAAHTGINTIAYGVEAEHLFIRGGSPRSTLNAVYTFLEKELGCRFYSPSVEQIPAKTKLQLPASLNYSYTPPITTRTVHSRLCYDHPAFADKLKVTTEAFPAYVPEARVHTFHRFVPANLYYQEHPEYYALRNGKRIPTQLCLTNEAVFQIVKDTVASLLEQYPEANVISVSQDDNTQYCQCANCEAIHEKEASPSGSMIHFVNRIARVFPNKQISTLAYQYTRKAPKTLKPEPNVLVTLCSIECDRSAPIEEKCSDFTRDLIAWGEKTDNIRIWDYTTQFTNFLAPFPNLYTLQPNIELFVKNNAKWVFEQHSNQPSELFELRSYLTAQLLWNPTADVDLIIADFLEGYYQAAAPFVKDYITTIHKELAKDSSFFLFLYGDPSQGFGSFLKEGLLNYYDSLYNEATLAVTEQPEVLKRVQEARLSIDYAILENARRDMQKALQHSAALPLQERLLRFEQTTRQANITAMNEMGYTVEEYIQLYKQSLERAAKPNLAHQKPVKLLELPKKYAKEDPQTLTDGAFGGSSFYANWLGFEGNNLEAVIDLGEPMEISEISTAFLQVTNHIVFFPEEVQYFASSDGQQFRAIASLKNQHPLSPKSKINDIQYFTYTGPLQTFRYLKVIAVNPKVAPVWHHAANLPSWIFVDEVELR